MSPIRTGGALATRPWITIEWLPRYTSELNDIKNSWRDLKIHYLVHLTFADDNDLGGVIRTTGHELNQEKANRHLCDNPKIAA